MSEYGDAGVDYRKIQGFKDMMVAVGKQTRTFPNRRDIYLPEVRTSHGAIFEFNPSHGIDHSNVRFVVTQEGLGNKNWIAELMYMRTGIPHYEGIGIDTMLMAINDVIAQGAMPVVYCDEVAAGSSEWFEDSVRAADLALGFYNCCEDCGVALGAGESPALRYLISATEPVMEAPSLSGSITGIIAPSSGMITGEKLAAGDIIVGAPSSGLHSNGISLVIKRAMDLPDDFMTRLPNGNTLGEEALIPTMQYVDLVSMWQEYGMDIHALLPGTGHGVAKLAFDDRDYTYRVTDWPTEIPHLFLYMQSLGVSLEDLITTFNMGIGYYGFFSPEQALDAVSLAEKAGYQAMVIGQVEEGPRQTIVEPGRILNKEQLTLPPAGD